MKKLGFTLVEILVAFGIIGIISALLIPQLQSSYKKQVYASTLATTASNFENAMAKMMSAENVTTLWETNAWQDLVGVSDDINTNGLNSSTDITSTDTEDGLISQFQSRLSDYLKISGVSVNTADNAPFILRLENGTDCMLIIYPPDTTEIDSTKINTIKTNGGQLIEVAGELYVDVNTVDSKPNKVGRDSFAFYIGNDGTLYPFGGLDVSLRMYQNKNNVWENTGTSNKLPCNKERGLSAGCTARLVENGYKMDY